MKIGIKKTVEVDARTLKIHMKVRDTFVCDLFDQDGLSIHGQSADYVPDFMPEQGGDYLVLEIDIETGKVLNWEPPTAEGIQEWINGKEDE